MNIKRIPKNNTKTIKLIAKQAVYCTTYLYGEVYDRDVSNVEQLINDYLAKGDSLHVNYDKQTAIITQHLNSWITLQLANTKGL